MTEPRLFRPLLQIPQEGRSARDLPREICYRDATVLVSGDDVLRRRPASNSMT